MQCDHHGHRGGENQAGKFGTAIAFEIGTPCTAAATLGRTRSTTTSHVDQVPAPSCKKSSLSFALLTRMPQTLTAPPPSSRMVDVEAREYAAIFTGLASAEVIFS
jgi:hypothetical protein